MVAEQLYLALGVGLPLLAIGTYTAWLARRVSQLEHADSQPSPEDRQAPGSPDRTPAAREQEPRGRAADETGEDGEQGP